MSNCEKNYKNGLEDGWGDRAAIVVQHWRWRGIGREGVEWWERERRKNNKGKRNEKSKENKIKGKSTHYPPELEVFYTVYT